MTKSSEWRTLSEDPVNTSDSNADGNSETNTQTSERKRRLLSSSKTKTHRRYIQDIVSFLKHEAVKEEEDVKYEHKTVGSDHVVRVTLGGDSVEARKKTLKLAKDAAAKEMMIMIGPYIEDDVWKRHSEQLSEAVPPQLRNTWLPPVFDARHVAVDGATWYEVDVQLGPLSAVSVTDNLHTSLESLASHTRHFLTTRNLEALTREPLEESLQEMEVYPHLAQPYVQARGVLEVRMDGPDGAPVIPPVDVFTMQLHLPGGRFPPSYGARDMFGCVKVFRSKLSGAEFSGSEQLLSHCRSLGHWRRLGKYFINGQLRETFNPGSEVGGAQQEGAWPAWELPAVSHPVQDRQCGRQVDTSDPRYVIAVMRCPDLLQQQQQVVLQKVPSEGS